MGGESTPVVTLYSRQLEAPGSSSSLSSLQTPVSLSMSYTVEDVLRLLRHLYVIMTYHDYIICNIVDGKLIFKKIKYFLLIRFISWIFYSFLKSDEIFTSIFIHQQENYKLTFATDPRSVSCIVGSSTDLMRGIKSFVCVLVSVWEEAIVF